MGVHYAASFFLVPCGHRSLCCGLWSIPYAEQPPVIHPVLSGEDRVDEAHSLGITSIAFKVLTRETNGESFIIEHTTRQKGGPPHHIHPHQDEWFYVIEGEFLFEVAHDRVTLRPGGSVLAPRNLPHAWAFVGNNGGKNADLLYSSRKDGGIFPRVD
jgi:quercetin dioxygenase-like cupin family protein